MDPGGQTIGTRDEHYDLIGVLCQALRGAENCNTYALDAETSGRTDLYEFFCEAQVTQTGLAERAKELLGISDAAPEKDTPSVTAAPSEDVAPRRRRPYRPTSLPRQTRSGRGWIPTARTAPHCRRDVKR